ncbi:MAG: polyphosphate kinase 2 family protein [Arcanobacterium sp.]|nr:polyphosphate kinase 2 family protein [Arcanobacterium sp.]
MSSKKHMLHSPNLLEKLRVPMGVVDVLADFDPGATTGYAGDGKKDADEETAALNPALSDLQERLYAAGTTGDPHTPAVLLILQGLDTAGKGGVIRHAIGLVDPQGITLSAFKAPTQEELAHDFLWRIEKRLPAPGKIGIFDRSQYEDVLIGRVEHLAPAEEIERRYAAINEFEARATEHGIHILKCFLHISKAEQRGRLLARLNNPEKYYKYNPSDVNTAQKYDAYMEAYSVALTRCNSEAAPWYVIPSDRKWYRNWAVAELLTEKLRELNLEWPAADFDIAAETQRALALPEK